MMNKMCIRDRIYDYMMWRDDKAFVEFMGKREKADWCRGRADHICNSVNRLCKNKDGFYTCLLYTSRCV